MKFPPTSHSKKGTPTHQRTFCEESAFSCSRLSKNNISRIFGRRHSSYFPSLQSKCNGVKAARVGVTYRLFEDVFPFLRCTSKALESQSHSPLRSSKSVGIVCQLVLRGVLSSLSCTCCRWGSRSALVTRTSPESRLILTPAPPHRRRRCRRRRRGHPLQPRPPANQHVWHTEGRTMTLQGC